MCVILLENDILSSDVTGIVWYLHILVQNIWQKQLEQLECLGSEDTPCHLMITHTIETYWNPSHKKTKWELQI